LNNSRQNQVLRASEIGNYAYCERGWWLSRVMGLPSAHAERMALGEQDHYSHGRKVVTYHRLERLGYLLLILSGVAALSAVSWWLAAMLLS
jgi:hypothetical protein